MNRAFQILLPLLFLSCNSNEKRSGSNRVNKADLIKIHSSDFDTLPNGQRLLDNLDSGMNLYYREVVGSDTLKGGYITCYAIDDSMRYFYLRHLDTLHLLNKLTNQVSAWSLGTLEKDLTGSFITRLDNGNQCPCSYQIFDKRTGKNILGDNVEALDYKFLGKRLFMLYGNFEKSEKPESITLFNISNMEKEIFKLPNDIPDFYDIRIDKLTTNNLKIIYSSYASFDNQGEKTKTYSR